MTQNDPSAFARAQNDPTARIQATNDPTVFGEEVQLVCPPLNTGNRRNQTSLQKFEYQPPGDPLPDLRYRARFDWIDSNTDAVAHLVYLDASRVIAVQDRPVGYNCETWLQYPSAGSDRWDTQQTGRDLGGTLPVDEALHLMGTPNAAGCPGYSAYILDYATQSNRDLWLDGEPVLLSRHDQVDDDQKFMSTLFGQLRAQMRATVVSTFTDTPGTNRTFGVLDFTTGSPTTADPADNMFEPPPARGVLPLQSDGASWTAEPPTGNAEGTSVITVYSRAIGNFGTHPLVAGVSGDKPETRQGWLDTYRLQTELSNFNPTPGTTFTVTL